MIGWRVFSALFSVLDHSANLSLMNESIDELGRGQFGGFSGREIADAFEGENSQKKENGGRNSFVEARSRSGGRVEERKVTGTKWSGIGAGRAVGAGVGEGDIVGVVDGVRGGAG